MTRPFLTMEAAINYVLCGKDDWYDEEDEAGDCLAWFEIEKWNDGGSSVLIGALKHTQFFGFYVPQISALYNARRVQKDSPNIDFELNDIGTLIRSKQKMLEEKTVDDMGDLLLYTVTCLVNGGCTKSQLMEGIRNI